MKTSRQKMASSDITRAAYLWTMFMISLLFGGAYAFLLDASRAGSGLQGFIDFTLVTRALLLP
jgi:hypothetical protein